MSAPAFRRGQLVTYRSYRWNGRTYEAVERPGKVVQLDGDQVRVLTEFGNCRVWMAAATLRPRRAAA